MNNVTECTSIVHNKMQQIRLTLSCKHTYGDLGKRNLITERTIIVIISHRRLAIPMGSLRGGREGGGGGERGEGEREISRN